MREIFIDTNVLIEYVSAKEPYLTYAKQLFCIAKQKNIAINVCALSYSTVYYYVKKQFNRETAGLSIKSISNDTRCLPVDEILINQAMDSQFRDYEDAIQYYCALQIPKCEAIITRDKRGFKLSDIPVRTPESFWAEESDYIPPFILIIKLVATINV